MHFFDSGIWIFETNYKKGWWICFWIAISGKKKILWKIGFNQRSLDVVEEKLIKHLSDETHSEIFSPITP